MMGFCFARFLVRDFLLVFSSVFVDLVCLYSFLYLCIPTGCCRLLADSSDGEALYPFPFLSSPP